MKRENAGSWNSGLEKEQILEDYSAQLQKSWNSTEYLRINKEKSSPKMKARRPTPCSRGWGAPPGRAPYLVGPLVAPRCPSSPIWSLSMGKNNKQPFGTRLRRHEAEPWRNQSRAPAELFCRGHFPSEGEIITIVITNAPLIGRGQSPSTSSPTPSHLQTLVHLSYPIFVPKHQIGTYGLLIVLITPCSWC